MTTLETIDLHPKGAQRTFIPAFLALWIAAWFVGEAFVLRQAFGLLGVDIVIPFFDSLPVMKTSSQKELVMAGLFLAFFFAVWTISGVGAITGLLRGLIGKDRIALGASGFSVSHHIGPLGKPQQFDRGNVDAVFVRKRDSKLVAVVNGEAQPLSAFGTNEERSFAAQRMRGTLGVPDRTETSGLAENWTEGTDLDGNLVLVDNWGDMPLGCISFGVLVGGGMAAGSGYRAAQEIIAGGSISLGWASGSLLGLMIIAAVLMIRGSKDRWTIGPNRLTITKNYGPWKWDQDYSDATLNVRCGKSSGGTATFTLNAFRDGSAMYLHSKVDDGLSVVALSKRLAEATGWDLKIEPGADEA